MKKKYALSFFVIIFVGILLDQITKQLAINGLKDSSKFYFGQRLGFELTSNSGSAFSLFEGLTIFITIIAISVVLYIIIYYPKCKSKIMRTGLSFIIAGALGNIIDRFIRTPFYGKGHVVDFLVLWQWPTFNIADMFVSVGVIVAIFASYKDRKILDERHSAKSIETS